MKLLRQHITILLSAIVAVILTAAIAITISQPQANVKNGSHSINKVKSGLFISDSLRNGNLTGEQLFSKFDKKYNRVWTLYGSAIARKAPVDVSENTVQGLSLGIKTAVRGSWAGYFAMTRDDYASLFHAVLTLPVKSLKYLPIKSYNYDNEKFSVGLYVQTSIIYGNINFVGCVAEAGPSGYDWLVESGTGNTMQVTKTEHLWQESSGINGNQSLTRGCTIITNGNNYLKVYLDNRLAFSSDNLNLQMPRPFNSYLEVQTTYGDHDLYGKFKDYYSTADENVKVINAPLGGIVKIIGSTPSSKLISYAPIDKSGVANLNIGQYHFPLTAQIQVFNSTNNLVASTAPNTDIFGGDIYSVAAVSLIERWTLK